MACSKFRKIPSAAAEHLLADEETGEVNCMKCDFESDDYKSAKRHVEQLHLKLFNRFVCNACSLGFSTKAILAVHLKEEHKDFSLAEKFTIPEEVARIELDEIKATPTFECKDCAYTTKLRRNLYRHVIAVHSKEKKFSCEDCGKSYGQRHDLMKHIRLNTFVMEDGTTEMKCAVETLSRSVSPSEDDPTKIRCTDCTFTASSEAAMDKHILRVHIKTRNLTDFELDENFRFVNDLLESEESLEVSNLSNETGEIVIQCCHHCDYKSDSKRNLSRHMRNVHKSEANLSCTSCSKTFLTKRALVQHIARSCKAAKLEQNFHRYPSNGEERVEKDDEAGVFKCLECPFSSPEHGEVLSHIEKLHIKLVCNFCSSEFAADDDVSEHTCDRMDDIVTNDDSGSNVYSCDECAYQSPFRNNVDKHMRSVHRKERNFLCSECGSQFSEQKSLHHHLEKMRTTTDDGTMVFRCAKFTKLPSRAAEHLHKDDATNLFLCNICDYTSSSQTDAKRHIQRIHLGERRYVCNTCNKAFTSQPEVGRHLARDHNDTSLLGDSDDPNNLKPETYKCQQCTYESPSRINVERHFSVVHLKERNYQCTECGQRYSDKKTLLQHVEKNTTTMPDGKTVLQCTKFTKIPSRAGEHLRKDEKTNLYHCVLCNYSAKNQSGAKRHVERMHLKEKRFVCNTCSQEFGTKKELAYHMGTEHNDLSLCENGGDLHSLKPEALQCEYCEYSSTVRQYLERHVKAVHLKERNFVCSECGFGFSEKKSLQSHIERNTITSTTGESALQCSKFKKLPSSASEHIAKDGSTNEFYCLQCSYRSKCPSDTKRHVERMHLKLKKFVCKVCDRGFSSKPNFYLHMATDHGDRSLIDQRPNIAKRLELHHCQFCSYSTKYPKDIQRHFNSIHNKERQHFFCDRCDKKFADKRGLLRHLRANH